MKILKKKLICKIGQTGAAVALLLTAGFVQAAPVTDWTYSTDSTFSNPSWDGLPGGTTSSPGEQTNSIYELSWGRSTGDFQNPDTSALQNRSALTVGNAVTGTKVNGGPATGSIKTTIGGTPDVALDQIKPGISLTHWNNPIDSRFGTLTGALITDTLTLTPTLPAEYVGQLATNAPTLNFNFKFLETPNAGICAGGSADSNGCPDLFGFVGALTLNNAFQYLDSGDDGILGNADDFNRTYFASIFVLDDSNNPFPLASLTPGECDALSLGAGCFGFRTAESAATTAKFAFAVTTEKIVIDVPEPGTLALLGLALAGLGFTTRRRLSMRA